MGGIYFDSQTVVELSILRQQTNRLQINLVTEHFLKASPTLFKVQYSRQ